MLFKRLWLEKLVVTIAVILFCLVSYMYVNAMNADLAAHGRPFTQLETPLDQFIPFVPSFVVFYYLYYVWVLLALPITIRREHFYHAAAAFTLLQATAIVTFILFPSFMTRPEVVGDDMIHSMVKWIYSVDTGFNLLPSLHVGHTTLIALLYWNYSRKIFPIVALGTCFISMSTVLIKQHFVIDIPFGFMYAAAAFYATTPILRYVPERVSKRSEATELS